MVFSLFSVDLCGAIRHTTHTENKEGKAYMKHYYLIVDTETTKNRTVADFGAVLCDKQGRAYVGCKVLVSNHFDKMELWFNPQADSDDFWSYDNLPTRRTYYREMMENGQRSLASIHYINNWLNKIAGTYDPILTAYNLPFDRGACRNTGIDLSVFSDDFCLYKAARRHWKNVPQYAEWALRKGYVTATGNAQYSADSISHWILGENVPPEPHTAFEDAHEYERPILKSMLKRYNRKSLLELVDA